MCLDAWLQMPSFSNHTIIKNFFLLSFLIAVFYCLLFYRKLDFALVFALVAPVGRCLLITMYFFGVFHKLNNGFLNANVSCAGALWNEMPLGLGQIDFLWFRHMAIYGTLIIEAIIMMCLLYSKTRFYAILLGVLFHCLLGLSGYAFYPTFSTLTVCLHILFLSEEDAKNIVNSKEWVNFFAKLKKIWGFGFIGGWFWLIYGLASLGSYSQAAMIWILGLLPFFFIIYKYGSLSKKENRENEYFFFSVPLMSVVSILFFLNCFSPYLGLKTAQSINMFANLRLEGGESNHLLISSELQLFGYLKDLVRVIDSGHNPRLNYAVDNDLALTYYDFLNVLDNNPTTKVSYYRGDVLHEAMSASDLKEDINSYLHPKWFRKWFHFNFVDLNTPKVCALNR